MAMEKDPDITLAALARRQHGLWTREQAREAGMTRSRIRTRVDRGLWIPQDTAVYADAASLPTWQRSVMAAVLAEPWAVASHRTAAALHRVPDFRAGRPEITIRPGANARGRLAAAHRGVDVQHTKVDGVPVGTLAQTFVDLAQVVSARRLQAALGLQAGPTPGVLDEVRDRYCELAPKGGRNLRTLRAALLRFGAGDLPTPSALEDRMRVILSIPSVPPIRWESPFPGRDPGKQRVDALIPDWSLIVEGDGRAWHTRVDDFERDRRRDAEAAAAGLQTLRFTWHHLTMAPDWVQRVVVSTGSHRAAA